MKKIAIALAVCAALPALAQESPELQGAADAYTSGDYEHAAARYYSVIESTGDEQDRQKSEYYLGASLFRLHLYQSALYYWSGILKSGTKHRYYAKAAEGLVDIAEAIDDDLIVPSLLNKEYNDAFSKLSPDYLHKVNFIIGEVSYRGGKLQDAKDFLSENGAVPKDSSYFARAQYLLGVMAGTSKSPEGQAEAQKRFERVRTLQEGGAIHYADLADLKELATLGLARVEYGLGHYARAVELYDSIPRFSEYWDQALFENGWARFMNDDPGGGLGSLEALHAPQFAGSFQPESWILKATIYHYSCLYDEVNRALASFDTIYKPMKDRIDALTRAEHEYAWYFKILSGDEIPRPVKNLLLGNKRLQGFISYIRQLDDERQRVDETRAFRESKLHDELLQVIDQQRAILVSVAGNFVKKRMEDAAKQIEGFDATAEIIRLENSSREKEAFEMNFDRAAALKKLHLYRPASPGPTYEYWKFDGEFWIDEIGYYEYTLKKPAECKEGHLERVPEKDLKAERQ